ncbi:hypothetical protein [Agromyces laixinhei]|nr:hypothetical protein [Agromyces laixinhei]
MNTVSMLMGASIASVAWIAIVPWSKLKRLKELDERANDSVNE